MRTSLLAASAAGLLLPSLAGPKRPQDRIEIGDVKKTFAALTED